ncbi:hypothetical protein [Pseudomonas sp. TCU-HL1]|uniref:hypothetical protein n=1 Tax=Pseudomonas sp. TCU-HL1 TaxID=1856685 RepID=UPI00083CBFDB|nr:hypothetical protein [Pseudomonas sp. TCU-HL1]
MKFLEFLCRYKGFVVFLMFLGSALNSIRFVGEWSNFWGVISVQLFFGQGFYCYIANKTIRLAPGGVKVDHPWGVRLLVGGWALLVYLGMFAFNGYGKAWGG